MVRSQLKSTTTLSSRIFGLALLNILPLGALAWLGYSIYSGRVTWVEIENRLGPGAGQSGAIVAAAIFGLWIVGGLLLRPVHALSKYCAVSLRHSAAVRAEAGVARCLLEWLLWPFRGLGFLVFGLIRFVLILVCLALILATLLGMARLVKPGLGDEWLPIREWLEWLRNR